MDPTLASWKSLDTKVNRAQTAVELKTEHANSRLALVQAFRNRFVSLEATLPLPYKNIVPLTLERGRYHRNVDTWSIP
jgi:hypothetical protein